MKKIDWKTLAELIGISAIVASLIFVGLQVRQDRQIAVSQNLLTVAADRKHWVELVSANSSIWIKGKAGHLLSPEEEEIYLSLADALELQYAADWFRAQEVPGVNSPEVFAYKFAEILSENPGLMQYWQDVSTQWARQDEYAQTPEPARRWGDSVNRALSVIRAGQ
jgi:hypothetical protein